MRSSSRLVLVPLLALIVALLGASSAQAFPEVGISQSYRDFGLNLSKNGSYQPNDDVSRSVFWGPLAVNKLRVIVPWDIADRGPGDGRVQEFENWLRRVKALNAIPFVVFGPTERTPSTDTAHNPAHFSNVTTRRSSPEGLVVPPVTVYRTAVEDFLATWGPGTGTAERAEVRTIGAWNEPNVDNVAMGIPGGINAPVYLVNSTTKMYETIGGVCPSGSSTDSNCGPLAAARFWNNARAEMSEVCSTCTVVAGEFDSDGLTNGPRFWALYAEKIELLGSARPQVMSFHGHHDVEALGAHGANDCTSSATQNCITRNFGEWLKGLGGAWASIPIWDTEVGAQHVHGTSPSSDDIAQRNRFNNLIDLENSYGVSRFYYYNFQHQAGSNDRSLIDSAENNPAGVNTRQRPIWEVIRCRSTAGCGAWTQPTPEATTGQASSVGTTSATLNGSVLTNGRDTGYYFQYGTTTAYGSTATGGTILGANTLPVGVSMPVTGLQPGTTYHFRLAVFRFDTGTTYGKDQTFLTTRLGNPVAVRNPTNGLESVYFPTSSGDISFRDWDGSKWIAGAVDTSLSPGSGMAAVRDNGSAQQWVYYPNTSGSISYWWWTGSEMRTDTIGAGVMPGTTPSVVRDEASGNQWVVYANSENAITVLSWNGTKWTTNFLGFEQRDVQPGSSPIIKRNAATGEMWVYYPNNVGSITYWWWTGAKWQVERIGGGVVPGTTPAAIINPANGQQWVYYANASGSITYHWWTGSKWQVEAIGEKVMPGTSPAVTRNPANGQQWVYYVNTSGSITYWWWTGSKWQVEGLSASVMPGTSPTVVRDDASGQQWVYYLNTSGGVTELHWDGAGWGSLGL